MKLKKKLPFKSCIKNENLTNIIKCFHRILKTNEYVMLKINFVVFYYY